VIGDILALVPRLLLKGGFSGNALKAVAAVAGSSHVGKEGKYIDAITGILPLVIPEIFGPDKEIAAQAVMAICRSLQIPTLASAQSLDQFVALNVPILVKFVKDLGRFVEQIVKCKENECPKIRAAICYILAGLLKTASRELNAKRDEISSVVASFMGDGTEEVRLAAAQGFGLLVT
jgi:hypothetical protein